MSAGDTITANTNVDTDVAIVGGGPVGAVLAGLLGKRGHRVTVVERELDVFPQPRAAHIDHTGLRVLQELGCLDDLLPEMLPNPGLDFVNARGQLLMQIPAAPTSISGLPASMYFHQPRVDRTIRAFVGALPTVDFHVGATATACAVDSDRSLLSVELQGGKSMNISARWVVGCDGASGVVREWCGIEMEDLDFAERWLVVNLLLERSIDTLPELAIGVCDPARPLYSIPMPAPRHRFEFMLFDDEEAEDMQREERIFELLPSWVEPAVVTIERSAVYNLRGMVAEGWRAGRVFLAGDAAHQMPPFLGQGMCSGLRDAANLAWKLDHVLRRGVSERLLDTYTTECRPHVRSVASAAIGYGRLVCQTDAAAARDRDEVFARDPRPLTERVAFRLPRLEPGPLVLPGGGSLFPQPYPETGEARLDDVVGSRFLVLGRTGAALAAGVTWWEAVLDACILTLDDLPKSAQAPIHRWMDSRECDVVVVRPDRYVLGHGNDLGELTMQVAELFEGDGEPIVLKERSPAIAAAPEVV